MWVNMNPLCVNSAENQIFVVFYSRKSFNIIILAPVVTKLSL